MCSTTLTEESKLEFSFFSNPLYKSLDFKISDKEIDLSGLEFL